MSFDPREKTAQEHVDGGTFNPAIYLDLNGDLRGPNGYNTSNPYTAGDLANATAHFLAYGYGEKHRPVFPAGHVYEFGHPCAFSTVLSSSQATTFGGPYLHSSARRVDNVAQYSTLLDPRPDGEDPARDRGAFELLSDERRHVGRIFFSGWALDPSSTLGNFIYVWNGTFNFVPKAEWRVILEAPVTEIKLTYSPTGLEEDEVLAITYSIPADESPSMHDIFGDSAENAGAAGIGHGTTPDGGPPLIWLNGVKGGGGYQDVYVKSFRWTSYGLGYFYDYTAVNFDPLGSSDLPYDWVFPYSYAPNSRWPGDSANVMAPFDDMTIGGLGLPVASYPALYTWEDWNTNFNSSAPSRKRDIYYPVAYATHPHRSPTLPLAEGDPMILKLGWGDAYRQAVGVPQGEVASQYATWLEEAVAQQNGTYVSPDTSDFDFGLGDSYVRIYVNGVRGVDD